MRQIVGAVKDPAPFVLHGYLLTAPMTPVSTGCPLENPYCHRGDERRCPTRTVLGDRTCTLDEHAPEVLR